MASALRAFAWIFSGVAAVLFLGQPVSVETQLALALAVLIAMAAVWRMGSGLLQRQLFVALGSFVVIRYLYWRITSTLPPATDPLGLSLGALLLLAEIYCVLILVISLTISAEPLKRKPLPCDPDEDLPTVDVFIPTYNEDEPLLAATIAAAKSMDYPAEKLFVWLLDDGGTANGGQNTAVDTVQLRATIVAVSDPPTSADASIRADEDVFRAIVPADLPFADAADAVYDAGDPLAALVWFVNELSGVGQNLSRGQFVTTGACVTPIPVLPGQRVEADHGWLGRISASFV